MKYKDILYTKEDGIATITLNRPENRNAFTPEMTVSLRQATDDAAKDDQVRVLILTGSGHSFCSGADVKSMARRADGAAEKPAEDRGIGGGMLFHNFPKPVIAAVNGVAAGGGLDMALSCDIRIASDRARFAEVFIRRGLIPAMGGTYYLPRLVGVDWACLLIWTGDMLDAGQAERLGLVTMVVPHEELDGAVRELAEKIVKGPPLAIRRAKQAIYEGLHLSLEETLKLTSPMNKELIASEDHKEGARAFIEKREPVFKGK
ncbi:MAG: enoyl-CoA hydratase [Deltaproteobacteria bacterium]|nr:enoyl-CoA hydratase [Deltaproteobacteria bacterium]